MLISKEKIRHYLHLALSQPVSRLYFTGGKKHDCVPLDRYYFNWNMAPRFIINLRGCSHVRAVDGNGCRNIELKPGEAIWGIPPNRIDEFWDRSQEMLGMLFRHDFTRIIYIVHNGSAPPPSPNSSPNPTYQYHTLNPVNKAGYFLYQALCQNAECEMAGKILPGGELMLHALMENVNYDLENECDDVGKPKNNLLWRHIDIYLRENFSRGDLTRDETARHFNIHPASLSRLCQANLNCNFKSFVMKLRFDLALDLLSDPRMNINQIAYGCGFESTSYFIKAFKKKFHCTPGEYRRTYSLI